MSEKFSPSTKPGGQRSTRVIDTDGVTHYEFINAFDQYGDDFSEIRDKTNQDVIDKIASLAVRPATDFTVTTGEWCPDI